MQTGIINNASNDLDYQYLDTDDGNVQSMEAYKRDKLNKWRQPVDTYKIPILSLMAIMQNKKLKTKFITPIRFDFTDLTQWLEVCIFREEDFKVI